MGIKLSDIFLKAKLSKLLVLTNSLLEICSCDVISSLYWHKNGLQSHQWLFHVLLESVHVMQNIRWDLRKSFSDLINIFRLCRGTLINVKAPNFIIIYYLLIHQINPWVSYVAQTIGQFWLSVLSYRVMTVCHVKEWRDELSAWQHKRESEEEGLT